MVIAGVSFAATATLLPALRRLALRLDALDRPGPGKIHAAPTPYVGGLAIAVTTAGASVLLPERAQAGAVVLPALAVAAVGLADDAWDLRPSLRLGVEAAAAVAVFFAGARSGLLSGAGDVLLTVAWLVLLTNAFNLLDNMDGCAGLVATVTATALAVAAGLEGGVLVGGLAAALAGSSAAFLISNWHPARVFLGDAGSLFVGFVLAALSLRVRFPRPRTRSLAAVVLLAAPALFDTTLVVVSRLVSRRPVTGRATDHAAHRLRQLGMSIPAVALLVGLATTGSAVLGVLVGRGVIAPAPALAASVALAAGAMVALLAVPVYEDDQRAVRRSAEERGRRRLPMRARA